MADFICSVYYDNFAKNVQLLSPGVQMFSKKDFIREVSAKILFGFLISVNSLQRKNDHNKEIFKSIVALSVRDIVQFKLNADVTVNQNMK